MKQKRLINFAWLLLIVVMIASCKTELRDEAMQATSNSKKAKELYKDAYQLAYGILELDKAVSIYEQAIKEDSNFFMAYYQLATYHLFHQDNDEFIKTAESAIRCDIKLSEGEKVQKSILETWLNNREGDASELGKKLIKLYPNDPDSYLNLGYIYYINKDYSKAIEVFKKSISMEDIGELYCGPKLAIVPICMLGYSYLVSDQLDNAKESFDEYISQFPNEQNPYDCKADYFLAIKDYESAYHSYMTAYNLDTTYNIFLKRALSVKELADSLMNIE
jgi:Tfp pilus assembly protein PilF